MIEFYKEKLTFYRLLLTFAITALSGCIAWVFTRYNSSTLMQILANALAILCLIVLVAKTIKTIRFYQDEPRRIK